MYVCVCVCGQASRSRATLSCDSSYYFFFFSFLQAGCTYSQPLIYVAEKSKVSLFPGVGGAVATNNWCITAKIA